MTTSTPRVLIAENQYLIAMEVERILQENLTCDVSITPLSKLATELSKGEFEIVIIDVAPVEQLNVKRATMIEAAGAMPVFLSSYDYYPNAGTTVSTYPVVSKPPQPEQLAAAVMEAMRQRASNGKGLLDDR